MNQSLNYDLTATVAAVRAANLYSSCVTVRQATNIPDVVGQVDLTSAGFADIAGAVAVPCMRAPISPARIYADETKFQNSVESLNVFHLLLDGYYAQVPEAEASLATLQAVVDGVTHEVLGVESDSQKTMTRLKIRQVGA